MKLNSMDIVSMILRVVAVSFIFGSDASQSSAIAYLIWDIMFMIVAYETHASYGINKTFIFVMFSIVLYSAILVWMIVTGSGEIIFSKINVIMLCISLFGFAVRSYVRKNYKHATMILIGIQKASATLGSIIYCVAVMRHPENYTIYIVYNWIFIIMAYSLVIYNGVKHGEKLPMIVFNLYGILVAIIYAGFILYYSIGWF
jgi:hypothetical protein